MRRRVLPVVILAALLVGAAAIITVLTPPSTFRAQALRGAGVYQGNCLSCHGGAGGPGVPGKTEPLEGPTFRARNPTALEIYDVVRSGREPTLNALSDSRLWEAIAAELSANGVDLGNVTLGASNAASAGTGAGAQDDPSRFYPPGH